MSPRPKEAVLGPEKGWTGGRCRSSHEEDGVVSGSTAEDRALLRAAACAFEHLCVLSSGFASSWFLPPKLQPPVQGTAGWSSP